MNRKNEQVKTHNRLKYAQITTIYIYIYIFVIYNNGTNKTR